MKKVIFTYLLILLVKQTLAHDPDTLYAKVEDPKVSTSNTVIQENWLVPATISQTIDSLQQADHSEVAQQLQWIHSNALGSEEHHAAIIDSLFQCSPIPYPLINHFNTYLSKLAQVSPEEIQKIREVNHHAPFFEHWDNQHPWLFAKNLSTKDSLSLTFDSTHFHYPVPYKAPYKYHATITSEYGWRNGRHHRGLDIELHVKDSVVSAFDGVVRLAKYYGGYGRVVIIRHFNGVETLYAHLYRFKASVGDTVQAGDLIGLGGNSGHSEGSHLHFEMRYLGSPINPKHIIDTRKKQLKAYTYVLKKYKDQYVALIEGTQYHKVRYGDHWYKIAKRYGLEVRELYRLNGISKPHRLSVGQMIRVGI